MSILLDPVGIMHLSGQFYYNQYTTTLLNNTSSNNFVLQNDSQHKIPCDSMLTNNITFLHKSNHIINKYHEHKFYIYDSSRRFYLNRTSYPTLNYLPQNYNEYRYAQLLNKRVPILSNYSFYNYCSSPYIFRTESQSSKNEGIVSFTWFGMNVINYRNNLTKARLYHNRLVKSILFDARSRSKNQIVKTRFCRCAVT